MSSQKDRGGKVECRTPTTRFGNGQSDDGGGGCWRLNRGLSRVGERDSRICSCERYQFLPDSQFIRTVVCLCYRDRYTAASERLAWSTGTGRDDRPYLRNASLDTTEPVFEPAAASRAFARLLERGQVDEIDVTPRDDAGNRRVPTPVDACSIRGLLHPLSPPYSAAGAAEKCESGGLDRRFRFDSQRPGEPIRQPQGETTCSIGPRVVTKTAREPHRGQTGNDESSRSSDADGCSLMGTSNGGLPERQLFECETTLVRDVYISVG